MDAHNFNLALVNVNVLTMDAALPSAESVAVAGDRIATVGSWPDIRGLISKSTSIIDCQRLTLLPGFNDAHIHLAGLARRLQDLDCGPARAPCIAALQKLVRNQAVTQAAGSWVRGHGYDDLRMAEGRHPSRWDLDVAAPEHPVWLEHRSGHAAALNSRAMELAGIHRYTPDPPGGVIERDPGTGEPTGMLYEMHGFLRDRLGNVRGPEEFEAGMRAAGNLLNRYGITSVQDAGAGNGIERWRTFRRLQSEGVLECRITMFAGAERLGEFEDAGLVFGCGDAQLRLGHAKIMLTLTSGALHPSAKELASLLAEAHCRGFPVAIHCIEEEAIVAAAEALAANSIPGLVDRIEHCAEGTPIAVQAVKRSGAAVVTNPGFIYHNGAAYREDVEEGLLPHLYPTGALHRAHVAVAFGSDAPVIDPNPWKAIYSAVTRRDAGGTALNSESVDAQRVTVVDALRMHTAAGAEVEGNSRAKGSITAGKLADFVLVNADPLAVGEEELPEIEAVMTVVGGSVVWSNI